MTCRGHRVLRKLASKRADPNRPREAGSPTFQAACPSNAAECRSARSGAAQAATLATRLPRISADIACQAVRRANYSA
jgi:hypothetical protein